MQRICIENVYERAIEDISIMSTKIIHLKIMSLGQIYCDSHETHEQF